MVSNALFLQVGNLKVNSGSYFLNLLILVAWKRNTSCKLNTESLSIGEYKNDLITF